MKPIPDIASRSQVKAYGEQVEMPYRALYYIVYLCGCRISEALAVRESDFETVEVDGKIAHIVTLQNLKNKKAVIKRLTIGTGTKEEFEMLTDILSYKDNVLENDLLFKFSRVVAYNHFSKILVTIPATDVDNKRRILDYTFKLHPHYLRHCRLSHLVNYYNLNNPYELMQFAGWANITMAQTYIQSDWRKTTKTILQKNIFYK